MKTRFFFFLGAAILMAALFGSAEAQSLENVGFVPGNVWFSKVPFFAGDKIRIYTVVFNGSGSDLSGTLEFYDNANLLGKSDFSMAVGNDVRNIWLDWTATKGNHRISAKITDAKISRAGEEPQSIVLKNSEAQTKSVFMDSDTDKDGIGDAVDTDDDNDGLTDIEEVKIGTNPLAADTDADGAKDGEEIQKNTNPLEKTDAIADAGEIVSSNILKPAVSAAGKLEDWRKTTATDLGEKVSELKKEKEIRDENSKKAGESGQETPAAKNLFEDAPLFLLSLVKFVFEVKVVFYLVLAIAAYYCLRFILRHTLFRKRKKEADF